MARFCSWVTPLTGEGSPDVLLQKTSIGASGARANGGFVVSTNLNAGVSDIKMFLRTYSKSGN